MQKKADTYRLVGVCFFIADTGIPPPQRLSLDQKHGKIVDVGAGGPGHNQAVHCLQCVIGVILLQHGIRGDSLFRQALHGAAVYPAARRIRRAVGSVGAHGENQGIPQSGNPLGGASASSWFRPPKP